MTDLEKASRPMTKQEEADLAWKKFRSAIETSSPEVGGAIVGLTQEYLRRISAEAYLESKQDGEPPKN